MAIFRKHLLLIVITILVFTLDRLSKFYVSRFFSLGDSIPIIKSVFHLTYLRNPGAAFGLFPNQRYCFILLSIIILFSILFYVIKAEKPTRFHQVAFSLVLGGILGNLVDRISNGLVVDFLDFRIWPVFNLADSALVLGVTLLLFGFLRKQQVGKD